MRSSIRCRLRRRVGWALGGKGARSFVALGAVAGLLTTAEPAGAETKFAFSWRAEPGTTCLTEAKVRASVEKKLGRSVFSSLDDADIVIDGEEVRDPQRYRARVTQRDRAGRELGARELTAETCSALERMTVVFIALVLEPGGAPARTESEALPEPTEPNRPPENAAPLAPKNDAVMALTDTAPDRRGSPPAVAQAAPAKRVELHAGLGVGASSGMLPGVSASLRLTTRLTLHGSRLSADWSAGFSLPQTVTEGAVRATFTTVDQQARGCWALLDRAPARIDGCGGAFFGALVPHGANLDDRSGASLSLLGPTASVALRVSDALATVHVEVGIVAPAFRRSIKYLAIGGEERTLHTTPPLMATAALAGTFRVF